MNRGAHLLATGSACVEGKFVREVMLSLDGISVGGQSTRERECHPCNVCDKASPQSKDSHWGDHPQSERVGEEERMVLASFRKRADILYPLKWKSIVLVFNKFVCKMFFICFFHVVSQEFWGKLIINVDSNNYIIFFFLWRKYLYLRFQLEGRC